MVVADPAAVGERVLRALSHGRTRAITAAKERAALVEREIRLHLDLDILRGHLPRGRAKRISLAMRGSVSERHVKRLLDKFFSVSDSSESNVGNSMSTMETR